MPRWWSTRIETCRRDCKVTYESRVRDVHLLAIKLLRYGIVVQCRVPFTLSFIYLFIIFFLLLAYPALQYSTGNIFLNIMWWVHRYSKEWHSMSLHLYLFLCWCSLNILCVKDRPHIVPPLSHLLLLPPPKCVTFSCHLPKRPSCTDPQ
jgi:hypothetical protein